MSSRSKRQTMAKMTRERLVKERRARKEEKKQAAAAARHAENAESMFPAQTTVPAQTVEDETPAS